MARIEISLKEGKKQWSLDGTREKKRKVLDLEEERKVDIQGPVEIQNKSEDSVFLCYDQGEVEYHILLGPSQRWSSSGKVRIWK